MAHSIFFHSSQTAVISIKASGTVSDGGCQLDRVGRGQTIPSPELGGLVRKIHGDRDPVEFRIGGGQCEDLLRQLFLLLAVGLNQQFEKGDG